MVKWEKPEMESWKLNIDGSYIANQGRASAGGVVRNRDGQMLMAFAAPVQFLTNNFLETTSNFSRSSFRPFMIPLDHKQFDSWHDYDSKQESRRINNRNGWQAYTDSKTIAETLGGYDEHRKYNKVKPLVMIVGSQGTPIGEDKSLGVEEEIANVEIGMNTEQYEPIDRGKECTSESKLLMVMKMHSLLDGLAFAIRSKIDTTKTTFISRVMKRRYGIKDVFLLCDLLRDILTEREHLHCSGRLTHFKGAILHQMLEEFLKDSNLFCGKAVDKAFGKQGRYMRRRLNVATLLVPKTTDRNFFDIELKVIALCWFSPCCMTLLSVNFGSIIAHGKGYP
ncbi:hypothetical protein BC332_01649 [Capsicum chinense]|nr:hypothetical protein BC332_01649 [Capsicum chinense]